MKLFHGLIILSVLLCVSCSGGRNDASSADGDTISLSYATNLQMIDYKDFTKVILSNPTDSNKSANAAKPLHVFLLVAKDKPVPSNLPDGTVIRVPVEKALVCSSVYCGLMMDLGCDAAIGGVCDAQYLYSDRLKKRLKNGNIVDCGNSMSPDIEKIIKMQPDVMMVPYLGNSNGYGKLQKLGVPLLECADYMESSALGRTEWMKFYGRLFGCGEKADSMFTSIADKYNRLKLIAKNVKTHPKLLVDTRYGQVWYAPGANSTMGQMYKDAGATLPFPEFTKSGSIPLSSEQMFARAYDADFWLVRYNKATDMSLTELGKDDAFYPRFRAFKNRNVYGCNTQYSAYYDETPFHPERLLSDLIQIFHPELTTAKGLRYFHKMKP